MDDDTMAAAVLHAYGRPLELRALPVPQLRSGRVLVRVEASGVNPLDTKIRSGLAAHARTEPPAILGIDMAGLVVAAADDVDGFSPGDAVFGMTGGVGGIAGSLADYVSADARLLARRPARWTAREAAAVPLAAISAWEGLVDRAGVRAGHRVLIHGGAGGVGHIAIQLALARGCEVFATGSGEDLQVIADHGAVAIDYRSTPPARYVEQLTGGVGFDVVFDTVGGETLDGSFESVRVHTGHVVSILGWGTHRLAPLSFRGATYSGVFTLLPLLTGVGREHHGKILRAVADLADSGSITPRLDPRRFSLASVHEAHRLVETGAARGKVVVDL